MNIDGEKYYTVGELAKIIGKSPQTIKRWEDQGKIPSSSRLECNKWRIFSEKQKNIIVEFVSKIV